MDRSVRFADAAEQAPEPMEQSNAAPGSVLAAAAPSTTGAAASGTGPTRTGGGAARPAPVKRAKLVRAASLARRGGRLSADVRVARGRGVRSVRVALLHGERTYASASRRLPSGRVGLRLTLRELRTARPGRYVLRVITTDRSGRRTVSSRHVTLR